MSLPLIDINAGDTMSGMVDKINYNFTLISLKGGGPAGIQGIQGLRGPVGPQGMQGIQGTEGNMIYNINPNDIGFNPNNYNIGDTLIYNGIIYQIVWGGSGNAVTQISNLYDSVQSPFGLAENDLHTINPHTGYEEYPFILGIDTGNVNDIGAILANTASDHGVLNLSDNMNLQSFVKFITNTNVIGTIKTDNGILFRGDTSYGIAISGPGTNPYHIQVDSDGIKLPKNRIINGQQSTSFIVSTELSGQYSGRIDNNLDNAWCTKYENQMVTLFPFKNANGSQSSIGMKSNLQHRIDQICLNKTSNVFFDTGSNINEYANIKVDNINNIVSDVMSLSKWGVGIGGMKNLNIPDSIHAKFEDGLFSIKFSTPSQWETGQKYGTMVTITSIGNNSVTGMTSDDKPDINYSSLPDLFGNSTDSDWLYRGKITLSSGTVADAFRRGNYSNMITADRKSESGSNKSSNDTLHIHGADSMNYSGNDILLSGGNQLGGSSNKSATGGNVYISGGSAFNSGGSVFTDMKRYGDIIIGINPLNHAGCLTNGNFTSTSYKTNNGSTNPDGVGFFDSNNIALHGNRIVIDSHANFRKITDGYTKDDHLTQTHGYYVQKNMDWRPYANSLDNTTLQVSCVNTLSHETPVVISRKDICSHQFISGVMRRIMRFRKIDGNEFPVVEFVSPDNFTNSSISGNPGSIYFITEQIWQKTGNIVHVNAFGRWLTDNGYDTGLYHIADHFFTKTYSELGGVSNFNNNLLKEWLLDNNNTEYLSYPGPNWPMTVFALPVVVEGMLSTFCYGNGNIYTEDNFIKYRNSGNHPIINIASTNSVIQSAPVMIGAYHKPSPSERTTAHESFGYSRGNRSALYKNMIDGNEHENFNSAFHSKENNSAYDFMSTSIRTDDGFRYVPNSSQTFKWVENSFTHTELYDNDNYCYIYPEMMTDTYNVELYGNAGMWRQSSRIRPCIGMYTWISLDYSYSVMDGFNGNISPMTNKSNELVFKTLI